MTKRSLERKAQTEPQHVHRTGANTTCSIAVETFQSRHPRLNGKEERGTIGRMGHGHEGNRGEIHGIRGRGYRQVQHE